MYRKILVPVDGSPAAAAGLSEAIRLASVHGAAICLLHVLEKLPALQGMEVLIKDQVLENLEQFGRKVLQAARSLVEGSGLRAHTVFQKKLQGRVAEVIVRQARTWNADLIVMGTHGRRGVIRLMLGSDAEAVARSAAVPVMLVRSPGGKTRDRS